MCSRSTALRPARREPRRPAARDKLRDGVEAALLSLGNGFLSDSDNGALRERLRKGELSLPDFFGQLLRLVYRLILARHKIRDQYGANLWFDRGAGWPTVASLPPSGCLPRGAFNDGADGGDDAEEEEHCA